MYLAIATLPDLCYAVCYLIKFQDSAFTLATFQENIKIYLKGAMNTKLVYRRNNTDPLVRFADSYWANNEGRKFTSTVLWASRKQGIVTTITEAEKFS